MILFCIIHSLLIYQSSFSHLIFPPTHLVSKDEMSQSILSYSCLNGQFSNVVVNNTEPCNVYTAQAQYTSTSLVIHFLQSNNCNETPGFDVKILAIAVSIVVAFLCILLAILLFFGPLRDRFFPYRDNQPEFFQSGQQRGLTVNE